MTAKVAVLAPFAQAICDNMGYEKKSKGAAGLFMAMFIALVPVYSLFLSANFMCYALLGFLPKDIAAQITWMTWLINALPWGITMLVLSYLALLRFHTPGKNDAQVDASFINKQMQALGPMSRKEKVVLIILRDFIDYVDDRNDPRHQFCAGSPRWNFYYANV